MKDVDNMGGNASEGMEHIIFTLFAMNLTLPYKIKAIKNSHVNFIVLYMYCTFENIVLYVLCGLLHTMQKNFFKEGLKGHFKNSCMLG